MHRIDFLCTIAAGLALVSACGATTTTEPTPRMVRYSGTVNQPAAGGFLIYKISGAWTVTADGSLITGSDTLTIVDAKVYGVAGTGTITMKTKCVGIVGKDAWAESEVLTTTNPQLVAVGSHSILRLSLASGKPQGGGGPLEVWYPNGNVCADKPAAMPAFDLQNGTLTFP